MIDASYHDILGVGFGPSNLALAIALDDLGRRRRSPLRAAFIERLQGFSWHQDMLLPGTDMQIAFVKDLVTLRDPTSRFSFLNYLHKKGRLTAFINLKTFNPSRIEFNDYLRWAAEQLDQHVHYGELVERVEPLIVDGRLGMLQVVSRGADGRLRFRRTRHLVAAPGGRPHVPAPFDSVCDRRVLHSSRYLSAAPAALEGVARPRVAVIGGGQSGAEIAVDAGARFLGASVDLIIRNHALRPSDDSAFANEIFDPEAVDVLYGLERELRAEVLAELRHTNYAVVDDKLIAQLHAIIYEEKVRGVTRHRLLRNTELVGMTTRKKDVTLRLRDRLTGEIQELRYDAVIFATGYERNGLPSVLESLRSHLLQDYVDRNYRLPLAEADVSVHVQGWSETTHGLSDTLLSVLSVRAGEIVASIEACESALEARTRAVCA
jgi:L-ornithine N5-oxygenase